MFKARFKIEWLARRLDGFHRNLTELIISLTTFIRVKITLVKMGLPF